MNTPSAPVGMMDVARLSGVSQKTVSRVVNGEPHVSEVVRRRVQAVIDDVGYRPNRAARSLVTRRTSRVGLVAVSSSQFGPASTIAGVERAARQRGYFVSVARVTEDGVRGLQAAIEELLAQGIDALALSESTDLGHPALRVPAGLPIVSFDLPERVARQTELVVAVDEAGGARAATEHLLALGHETVHHLAGPSDWSAARRRIAGWRDALAAAGRAQPEPRHGDWSPRSGFEQMQRLLEQHPTAVFVANDHMAIGAIHAAERAGLAVPRDLSVVGFDDIPEAEYLSTPLTTVRQDFQQMTERAIARLVDAIEGATPLGGVETVPALLVTRESTAAPYGAR